MNLANTEQIIRFCIVLKIKLVQSNQIFSLHQSSCVSVRGYVRDLDRES